MITKLPNYLTASPTTQLLQVLGTRRLMHISFDEFEKTMALAHSVFQTWDDEYEKVREIAPFLIYNNVYNNV